MRLADAIEALVARAGGGVAAEAERLSAAYRGEERARAARTPAAVAAYLASRAPATYAAAAAVSEQLRERRPGWAPRTLLDVGAGPGVASWAALEAWPSLDEVVCVEAEPAMAAAGRELLPDATWVEADLGAASGPADLVLCSYVLGELVQPPVEHLWAQTADTLVLLEPGTPDGYRRILDARATVIAAGGHTVAPCPHDLPCPLPGDDWCHFAARLPRSRLHRQLKGGELGWEDEKFSYAALSREPVEPAAARVIRRPVPRSGYVELVTSESDGAVRARKVARSAGAAYKRARKAEWGDAIELAPGPRP